MLEKLKNLSNLQKALVVVIVLVVLWLVYKQVEELNGNVSITNKPNNQQDATELREKDPVILPKLYNRLTGQITDAPGLITLPDEIYPADGGKALSNYGLIDRLDDGYNGEMGLNYNMCSKSCCSPQYPTPFSLESDVMVESMKDKFVPNNYSCNNAWNNVGCVCMTKAQHKYLNSRGGNAPTCDA